MATHITDEHKAAFKALTSGEYDNFMLFSCLIDGAPGAAIVAVNPCPPADDAAPEVALRPLFVSVTPAMKLTDHDGRAA